MRKAYSIGVVLMAAFAFSAVAAQGAFAELTFEVVSWLIKAAVPPNGTPVLGESEILLEDTKIGLDITCSVHMQGETEEGGSGVLITDVLSLSERQEFSAGKELVPQGLLCSAGSGCENAGDVEVWPLNFPWLLEAMLDNENQAPWVLVKMHTGAAGVAAYEIKCLIEGVVVEETCTAAEGAGFEAKNTVAGVELNEKKAEPNGNCSVGGAGTGVYVPLSGNMFTSSEGPVAIS